MDCAIKAVDLERSNSINACIEIVTNGQVNAVAYTHRGLLQIGIAPVSPVGHKNEKP